MKGVAIQNGDKIRRFHEKLFSLNIAFAISYALFAYDGSSYIAMNAPKGVRDFLETFGS